MSFDLNLATLCDHVIYRELNVLGSDLRTIKVQSPLAASKVSLFATENLVPENMYQIVEEISPLDGNVNRVIYLNKEWRCLYDYFEVTYITTLSYCPKCVGFKYLDDISYDVKGSMLSLRDERLLMQNVEKYVITRINSNPFHTFIGTGIEGLIGTNVSNFDFLASQVKSEITRTLQKLQDLQNQYRASNRKVTSGEMLHAVENITVTQDIDDPTIMRASISVTAESGKTVQFEQLIRLRG